jgi:hypothetical protein
VAALGGVAARALDLATYTVEATRCEVFKHFQRGGGENTCSTRGSAR